MTIAFCDNSIKTDFLIASHQLASSNFLEINQITVTTVG